MIAMDIGLSLILTIVDDFIIVARDRAAMAEIKRRLRTAWTIVDKGPAQWVINLCVRRDRSAGILKLDQCHPKSLAPACARNQMPKRQKSPN